MYFLLKVRKNLHLKIKNIFYHTTISSANTAAAVGSLVWFLLYFPYAISSEHYEDLSHSRKISMCLASNSALSLAFRIIFNYEGQGTGIQWHNVFTSPSQGDTLTLGHTMLMLLFDSVFYLLIALYVEAVFPGEYGVPKPWYFLFTKSFWFGHSKNVNSIKNDILSDENFEKEPTSLQAGIKINSLKKVYANKKVAVRNLNLNMYEGQITVLLGHNGAGKTTTMSMLTGMIPATSGTAYVNGYDINNEIDRVRDSIGLCPQYNIIFKELTVSEHLYFFGKLKGLSGKEIDDEVQRYVELLDLLPKKNAKASSLSGGMKRKLCIGIALCGKSKIVLLDEPTAGIDPTARRVVWNLLLQEKKGRTILLSTHFMDEADILGDRVAIMAGGLLQCCGSGFFLKKRFGAGYHLVIEKNMDCEISRVTKLLKEYIPDIEVERNVGTELTYSLREDMSSVFEEMLEKLEKNSVELNIRSYGISLTTLEEVFMK